MDIHQAKKVARKLAEANVAVEASISEIYWVPREDRIYLVEIDTDSVPNDGHLRPLYFSAESDIPLPSGIAMVTPEEFGKISLPEGWGTWAEMEPIWTAPMAESNGR